MNILLVEVHRNRLTICGGNKMNVKEAFAASEFLGPITPADTEQLVRWRDAVKSAVGWFEDYDFTDSRYQRSAKAVFKQLQEVVK